MEQENKPFFSIIIPLYNTQDYIKDCCESILSQTFTNYECLIVDDGSTDNSFEICSKYASQNIRIMRQKNMGLSIARNNGILEAKGDYIVFLDSDDIFYDSNSFSNLYTLIKNNSGCNVVFHSHLFSFAENTVLTNYDTINLNNTCLDIVSFVKLNFDRNSRTLLTAWSFTANRKFLLQNNLFFKENIVHEDSHFVPRLLCLIDKILINHNYFYGYRRNRVGAITYSISEKRLLDMMIIIQELMEMHKDEKKPYNKKIHAYFCRNLWLDLFKILLTYKNENLESGIHNFLEKTSYCILYNFKIKHIVLFLLINIIGAKRTVIFRKIVRKYFVNI